MQSYAVVDIAKYVVTRCAVGGTPISNLKLQKILYYIQCWYLKEKGYPAFNERIEAWMHGPVIPKAYYYFCAFGATPITVEYPDITIMADDKQYIDAVVDDKKGIDVWRLVEDTHKPSGAWYCVYQGGRGNKQMITNDLILQSE